MGKKIVLFVLICSISCAGSLYSEDAKLYNRSIEYHGVVIEDVAATVTDEANYIIFSSQNVVTTDAYKNAIIKRIKDYEFLISDKKLVHVKMVNAIVSRDGARTVAGLYSGTHGIVYMTIEEGNSIAEMEPLFCHEMGHAFWDELTDDQKKEWYFLYQVRLDEGGLEKGLKLKYKEATVKMIKPFPSRYCLYNVGEYFAECFMFYNTDVARLNLDNFKEKQLLKKHIDEVRKAHGEESSGKEYYW